jgi:DNA replication protein DnaC
MMEASQKLLAIPNSFQVKNYNCQHCEDTGTIYGVYTDDSGLERTCSKRCECKNAELSQYLRSQMPPLYEDADLNTLLPWEFKHKKQNSVVKGIKENPFDSYLFVGDSGVGKSYMAWALWKNAAMSDRKAVGMTLAEFRDEYNKYAMDSFSPRRITPEELCQKHKKYTVLFDEVDKVKISEYSIEKFFQVLKNIIDYKHQLIVTTQSGLSELKEHFSQVSEAYGSAIMRRLMEGTTLVEMYK